MIYSLFVLKVPLNTNQPTVRLGHFYGCYLSCYNIFLARFMCRHRMLLRNCLLAVGCFCWHVILIWWKATLDLIVFACRNLCSARYIGSWSMCYFAIRGITMRMIFASAVSFCVRSWTRCSKRQINARPSSLTIQHSCNLSGKRMLSKAGLVSLIALFMFFCH